MILIDVSVYSFEEYIESLSKSARKNYAFASKHNSNLAYSQVPFNTEDIGKFMTLWEQQLIRGKKIKWTFAKNYIDHSDLICFEAVEDGVKIAMHFIERRDGYIECHPPMYDKQMYSSRYMAKFMWFSLIKWAINQKDISFLDLGAGVEPDWKEMIINREKYPNHRYKWMYVPEAVKNNPNEQKRYTIKDRTLSERILGGN